MMDADTFSKVFPISGLEIYPEGTVVIQRRCLLQSTPKTRSDIQLCSKKSLFRLVFLVRETGITFRSMLTLTYSDPFRFGGKDVKAHLNRLLTWLRSIWKVSYVWFLEFQRRGAPHFHVILSRGANTAIRERMAHQWSKIVSRGPDEQVKVFKVHNHIKSWEDIRSPDGAIHYVMKYAAKSQQKDVPVWYKEVGRFWGASRDVKQAIPTPKTRDVGEDELRGMLHSDGHPAREWEYLPKYVFARTDNNVYDSELTSDV